MFGVSESEEKAILISEDDLFLTLGLGTSSARNENLIPLLNKNTPLFTWGPNWHFDVYIVIKRCSIFAPENGVHILSSLFDLGAVI